MKKPFVVGSGGSFASYQSRAAPPAPACCPPPPPPSTTKIREQNMVWKNVLGALCEAQKKAEHQPPATSDRQEAVGPGTQATSLCLNQPASPTSSPLESVEKLAAADRGGSVPTVSKRSSMSHDPVETPPPSVAGTIPSGLEAEPIIISSNGGATLMPTLADRSRLAEVAFFSAASSEQGEKAGENVVAGSTDRTVLSSQWTPRGKPSFASSPRPLQTPRGSQVKGLDLILIFGFFDG